MAYDQDYQQNEFERDPAGSESTGGGYILYNEIGYDPQGTYVYRGTDGKLYQGGNGPNGFVPYEGSWDPNKQPEPTPTPDPTPDPGPSTPPPPGPSAPPPTQPYRPPPEFETSFPGAGDFTPPTEQPLPEVPVFNPPQYVIPGAPGAAGGASGDGGNIFQGPPAFVRPTQEEALNEPGYQFRLDQGQRALEASAAGRGVLNTGGTLKDLLQYGQDFASSEYNNVYNRKLNDYMTNYGTQYVDPYNFQYKAAADKYAPELAGYQNKFNATTKKNEFDYTNAYNKWVQDYNIWRQDQNDAWGRYKDVLKP